MAPNGGAGPTHMHHHPSAPQLCSYLQRKGKGDARRWAAAPLADEAAAEAAYRAALDDLAAFKRQSSVYGLYGRKFKTVLVSGAAGPQGRLLRGRWLRCAHHRLLGQGR